MQNNCLQQSKQKQKKKQSFNCCKINSMLWFIFKLWLVEITTNWTMHTFSLNGKNNKQQKKQNYTFFFSHKLKYTLLSLFSVISWNESKRKRVLKNEGNTFNGLANSAKLTLMFQKIYLPCLAFWQWITIFKYNEFMLWFIIKCCT